MLQNNHNEELEKCSIRVQVTRSPRMKGVPQVVDPAEQKEWWDGEEEGVDRTSVAHQYAIVPAVWAIVVLLIWIAVLRGWCSRD